MRDDFRVARRPETAALPFELALQLHVVVDLAVLRDRDGAVIDRDRLMPAGDVDDAEPGGAECRRARNALAMIVGPPVPERRDHAREPAGIGRLSVQREESSDSA